MRRLAAGLDDKFTDLEALVGIIELVREPAVELAPKVGALSLSLLGVIQVMRPELRYVTVRPGSAQRFVSIFPAFRCLHFVTLILSFAIYDSPDSRSTYFICNEMELLGVVLAVKRDPTKHHSSNLDDRVAILPDTDTLAEFSAIREKALPGLHNLETVHLWGKGGIIGIDPEQDLGPSHLFLSSTLFLLLASWRPGKPLDTALMSRFCRAVTNLLMCATPEMIGAQVPPQNTISVLLECFFTVA